MVCCWNWDKKQELVLLNQEKLFDLVSSGTLINFKVSYSKINSYEKDGGY